MSAKVRRLKKLEMIEEQDFKWGSYQGNTWQRYCIGKTIENLKKYLRKLERNL